MPATPCWRSWRTPARALPALLFYVITYALTVLGAFAVVAVVESGGSRDRFADFAGLSRRAPLLSFCMLVFMLSLAGIPPLSGFFGKFYVFTAAAGGAPNLGLLWLVIMAVAASAVSLYYYLQVLKQIYAGEPPARQFPSPPLWRKSPSRSWRPCHCPRLRSRPVAFQALSSPSNSPLFDL